MPARIISLETAGHEIRSAYLAGAYDQPYFFVLGAGVSVPSVPLAREIVEHCKQSVTNAEEIVPTTDDALDAYSFWFDRAYPQPINRQRYLRSLIANKPVPAACLRLAHLLASKRLSTLVVTSNFDDFVSRALTVFSVAHTVCDHPDTVDRIDLAGQDINIVHVHGSYKFTIAEIYRKNLRIAHVHRHARLEQWLRS
jgi:hypothetical protein